MSEHSVPVRAGGITIVGGTVKLIMRNYFSSHLLAAAGRMARSASDIEDRHDVTGESRFDLEQRGQVLSAILCGVGFFEAMVNELFQDALDGHAPEGSGIHPLRPTTRALMAEYWRATDRGRSGRALDKYQALLRFAEQQLLDEGAQPYQDASLAAQLRNAIAHYKPEDLSADEPALMEQRFHGKFPDNRLLTGPETRGGRITALAQVVCVGSWNPWWRSRTMW